MNVMIKVPKHKTEELKGMIEEGLHIFGRAMSVAESMCHESEIGERYEYGDRMGMRDYPMPPYGDRYPDMYGDRMGMRGRYSRY